ncbi:hypothetical protein PV398_39735, partial [Streptomyces ipomoeae]|nr:hypothetical protein [Streptomyces ipomoeae]
MTSETSGTGREPARSCAECGTRAEPGQSFCDSCGSVLNWSDTPTGTGSARTAPTRTDSARTDRMRAGATTTRNTTPGTDHTTGTTGTTDPADSPTAEPAWDAFARPGAGTGTARTAHDRRPTSAAAATARRTDDEPAHHDPVPEGTQPPPTAPAP